jgi:hypothetical protein
METQNILENTQIEVELAPSLTRFVSPAEGDSNKFRNLLLSYAQNLVTDLSLPVNISLVVRLGEGSALTSYQININKKLCRLQIPSLMPIDVEPEELARSVANGIYQNLELFLPTSLAEKIQKSWLNQIGEVNYADMSLDVFNEFLLEFIRHHLKINRAKEFFVQTGEKTAKKVEPIKSAVEEKSQLRTDIACPYTNCSGLVRLTDKFCTTCHRPLIICPVCGSVMAKDMGFCSNCGYAYRPGGDVQQKKQISKKNVKTIYEESVPDWTILKLRVLLPKNSLLVFSKQGKDEQENNDNNLENLFELMQEGLFYDLGVIAPKVTFDVDNDLRENEFRIQLNDLRFPPIRGLEKGHFLVNDTAERLSLIKITGKPIVNPANDSECAMVKNEKNNREICEQAGLTIWEPESFIVLAVAAHFRKNAADFLTSETVKYGINQLQTAFPALVDTVLRRYSLQELTCILKDLLKEEFSIRDLHGILETLITNRTLMPQAIFASASSEDELVKSSLSRCEEPQFDRDKEVELLRASFRRYLSAKYVAYGSNLLVFLLDSELEKLISNSEGNSLRYGAEENRALFETISNNLGNVPLASRKAVVLTSEEVRKKLRALTEKEFPNLGILSYQELGPEVTVQIISRISLSEKKSGDKT